MKYEPKPLFLERMKKLLEDEFSTYIEVLKKPLTNSIRCNTLKINPEILLNRLKLKGWVVEQPFPEKKEIMIVRGKISNGKNSNGEKKQKIIELEPGELGRSMEHLLGYYYIQEIASMLPVLTLKPQPGELVLDLAAAPGSKTTQIAAAMENRGTIIANDVSLSRLKILASNMERCGVTNSIITRRDGIVFCKKLKEQGFKFDKILVDAPCSGEGTIRSSAITLKMWNLNTIKQLSKIQKAMVANAIEILKVNGEIVYSTCTHAPEENEEVVDFILKNFDNVKIETINLPVKCRPGIMVRQIL